MFPKVPWYRPLIFKRYFLQYVPSFLYYLHVSEQLNPTLMYVGFLFILTNFSLLQVINIIKKFNNRDWRDSSAGKCPGCSSWGPRLDSQLPHGCSQQPIIPLTGNRCPLWHLWAPGTLRVHRHTCSQNTSTRKIVL